MGEGSCSFSLHRVSRVRIVQLENSTVVHATLLACRCSTPLLKTNCPPGYTMVNIVLGGEMLSLSKHVSRALSVRCSVASWTLCPYLCCHLSAGVEVELLSYTQSHSDNTFWETRGPTNMTWPCYFLLEANLVSSCWWVGLAAVFMPVGEVSEPTLQPCATMSWHWACTDTSPELTRCNGICRQHLLG